MQCQRCKGKVLEICAKCSDMCSVTDNGQLVHDGYAPAIRPLSTDSDYLEFAVCMDCGQIQGKWPQKLPGEKK